MTHKGMRDVGAHVDGVQGAKTTVTIHRPGIVRTYCPNHKRLSDIETIMEHSIKDGGEFEIDLFQSRIDILVYGL